MSDNVVPLPGIVRIGQTARRASHVTFAEHFTSQVITSLLLNGAALADHLKPLATAEFVDRIDSTPGDVRGFMIEGRDALFDYEKALNEFVADMARWAGDQNADSVKFLRVRAGQIVDAAPINPPMPAPPELIDAIHECNAFLVEVKPLAQMMLSHREAT